MATYDLEQQEQIEQAKHFWKKYGNLITWTLVIVLGAYAAWTGWLFWQNQQAGKAAELYEQLDVAVMEGKADKITRVFGDLKERHPGTTFAQQGALLAAKALFDQGKAEPARASLQWLIDNGKNPDLVAVARLRQAGLLMDDKKFDEALKLLDGELPEEFQALAQDRRGDIYMAQSRKDDALKAYQAAWKAMDPSVEYRRFIEGKLTALGSPMGPAADLAAPPAPQP